MIRAIFIIISCALLAQFVMQDDSGVKVVVSSVLRPMAVWERRGNDTLLESYLRTLGYEIILIDPFRIKDPDFLFGKMRTTKVMLKLVAESLNDASNKSYVSAQFLADYFSEDFGINRKEDFVFAIGELIRNAFLHGNKLDFNLPVYIFLDLQAKEVEVYDLAKEIKEGPAWDRMKQDAKPYLGGHGGSLNALELKGFMRKIEPISDSPFGPKLGTRAVIYRESESVGREGIGHYRPEIKPTPKLDLDLSLGQI